MRSESWKFIWQPNVSMSYLRATTAFRFRSFAFAFRLAFARGGPGHRCRPALFESKPQHFLGGRAKTVGDHISTEHTSHFGHARGIVKPPDGRTCAAGVDALLDRVMRLPVRRDLR